MTIYFSPLFSATDNTRAIGANLTEVASDGLLSSSFIADDMCEIGTNLTQVENHGFRTSILLYGNFIALAIFVAFIFCLCISLEKIYRFSVLSSLKSAIYIKLTNASSSAQVPVPNTVIADISELKDNLKALTEEFTSKVDQLTEENAALKEQLAKLAAEVTKQVDTKLSYDQSTVFQQQLEQVQQLKAEVEQMVQSECKQWAAEKVPTVEQIQNLATQFRQHQEKLAEAERNVGNKIHNIEMRIEAQIVDRNGQPESMEINRTLPLLRTISPTVDVNKLETRVANLVEENKNQKEALQEVNSRFSLNFRNISAYLKSSLKEWEELKKSMQMQQTEEQKARLFFPDFCMPESSIILDGKFAVNKCDEFLAFLHHGKAFCRNSLTLNRFDEFYQRHPTFFDNLYKHINSTKHPEKFISELKFNFENKQTVKAILEHFSFVRTLNKTNEYQELGWRTSRADKLECCAAPSAYGLYSADAWGFKVSSWTIHCSLKFREHSIEMKVELETGPDTYLQFGRHFARLP